MPLASEYQYVAVSLMLLQWLCLVFVFLQSRNVNTTAHCIPLCYATTL